MEGDKSARVCVCEAVILLKGSEQLLAEGAFFVFAYPPLQPNPLRELIQQEKSTLITETFRERGIGGPTESSVFGFKV